MADHATLVWGFPLPKGSHPFCTLQDNGSGIFEPLEAWENVFAISQGLTPPPPPPADEEVDAPEDGAPAVIYPDDAVLKAYDQLCREYRERYQATLAQFGGVTILQAGDEWNPTFFVAAFQPPQERDWKQSGAYAPLGTLQIPAEVEANLRRFCNVMGITYQEPSWMMVHSWGLD